MKQGFDGCGFTGKEGGEWGRRGGVVERGEEWWRGETSSSGEGGERGGGVVERGGRSETSEE